MSDLRSMLERERRKFRMGGTPIEDLERRRDTRRRNRRVASGVVAIAVAAVGAFAAFAAFDSAGGPRPGETPPMVGKRVPPPSSKLQFVDGKHGWMAVGHQIVSTSDGGRTWTTRYRGRLTALGDISGIQFIDTRHGWAVSRAGMLKTTDGGATWQRAPGTDAGWRSVQFVDRRIGWGIQLEPELGEELLGILMATRDGGLTWETVHAPGMTRIVPGVTRPNADAACFVDEKAGWVTNRAWIYQTSESGLGWLGQQTIALQGDSWTGSIRCVSSQHAWIQLRGDAAAGTRPYVVFRSGDGGDEPVLQERSSSPLGEKEKIYAAEDPQPGPFDAVSPHAAFFLNFCPPCGGTSALTRTLDGGKTWQRFDLPQEVEGEPIGLSFIDEQNGWATFSGKLANKLGETSNVFIYRTSDGGQSWQMLSIYRYSIP